MPDVWEAACRGGSVAHEDLEKVANELILASQERNVWLFYGEMGSGKTTLIKTIGKVMGVTETMSSPTFSIVNEYRAAGGKKINHFDLYRLVNEKEVFDVGVEEYFYSNELNLVEWPEKLGNLTPPGHFKVKLTPVDAQHRKIEYQRA